MSACPIGVEVGIWIWGGSNRDRDQNTRDCVLGVWRRGWEAGMVVGRRRAVERRRGSEVELFLLWCWGAQSLRRITTWIG